MNSYHLPLIKTNTLNKKTQSPKVAHPSQYQDVPTATDQRIRDLCSIGTNKSKKLKIKSMETSFQNINLHPQNIQNAGYT